MQPKSLGSRIYIDAFRVGQILGVHVGVVLKMDADQKMPAHILIRKKGQLRPERHWRVGEVYGWKHEGKPDRENWEREVARRQAEQPPGRFKCFMS